MGAILVSEVHLYSQLPMYLRLDRKNVEFMAKKVGLIFPEKKLFTSVPHQLIKKFICGHLVEEIITMLAILLVVRKSLP